MIEIRTATPADGAALAEYGEAFFRETFGPQNRPEDIEAYLAGAFSPERQEAEIADPAATVLLVHEDGELAGYAHVIGSEPPREVEGERPIELKRFYISHRLHGSGAARALMSRVFDVARARNADVIWLGVFERNPRAIAFYEKVGFRKVGEHVFVLGSDPQTDWIMARRVSGAP